MMHVLISTMLFGLFLLPFAVIVLLYGNALDYASEDHPNFRVRIISRITLLVCITCLVSLFLLPFAFIVVLAYKC